MPEVRQKGPRASLLESLRARLFLAILATAVPIIAGLSYYVWHQHATLVAKNDHFAASLVRTTAAYDNALLNDARGTLIVLSGAPLLRQRDWGGCTAYFASLLARLPRYMNLGVIDGDGRLVCSGQPVSQPFGTYLGDQPFYRLAQTRPEAVLSDFMPERGARHTPTLAMALRIPGNTDAEPAVLYLTLNLTYLSAGAAIPDLHKQGKLWILDRRGHVVQRIPNDISDLGERLEPHTPLRPGEVLQTQLQDETGQPWQQFDLSAGPYADPSGISVRYQIPEDSLYAEADRALWTGILAIFLLLCLAIVSAWGVMQLAAGRSLAHLRDGVRRLAQQDFAIPIAGQLRGRELKEIGQQFDAMAQALQTYQRTLKQSEQSYRLLFENSPSSMLVMSMDSGRFVAVNGEAKRQYGYSDEAFQSLRLDDLRLEIMKRQPDSAFSYERHSRNDGEVLLVEVRSLSITFEGELAYLLVIRDLTEHEALSRGLQQREHLLGQLMEVTAEAIFGLDVHGHCIFANQACAQLLGYASPEELVGSYFHSLAHHTHEDGRAYPQEDCRILQAVHDGHSVHVDNEVLWRRDGTAFPVEYWATPIRRDGELEMCLVTCMDISERRAQQRALMHQALHDPLTGLLNRGALLDDLHQRAQEAPESGWILVISNLDGFKEVNEALGHDMGDRLLQEVAQRYQHTLGERCVLARMGSDEFAFVLQGIDVQTARDWVAALLTVVREPFNLNDLPVRISSSFGLAQYPQHARGPDDLVRHADTAMRRAKRDGLGVALYDPEGAAHARNRLLLRGELRAALDEQQFQLYLQPKVRIAQDLNRSTVVGFEALTRWQHPQRGLISPGLFIPTIEVSDLIHPFTQWIIEQAVAACARLQSLVPGANVAVNVSTRNLLDARFVAQVRETLERHHLNPSLLELEVTESTLMADPARALKTLHELHALGARLSVDDFGTGYSSFSYLKKLPVHALKIDQSFVSGMADDADLQSIVRSMTEMAHTLGLTVIAEGIETHAVFQMLHAMGCDCGQGYLINRPDTLTGTERWLQARAAHAA